MNDFMKFISNHSVDELLFSICALVGLVLTLEKSIKWLLNKFNWYHKKKTESEDFYSVLKTHTIEIENINKQMEQFSKTLNLLMYVTKENTKHSITRVCEEYLERGSIKMYELQSLEDAVKGYESINGNSYVHTLMKKVRVLKVIIND